MRLFLRFSNTMNDFFFALQKEELLLVGLENLLKVVKNWKVMMIIRSAASQSFQCMNIFSCCEGGVLDRETLLRFVKMKSTFSDPLINSCLSTNGIQFWTSQLEYVLEHPKNRARGNRKTLQRPKSMSKINFRNLKLKSRK